MLTMRTMSANRYKMTLGALRISQRELARLLKCSTRLPVEWGTGRMEVPAAIGAWLEACLAVRKSYPYPRPPKHWRKPRGVPRSKREDGYEREHETIEEAY
jgi:hypothetical protein